jgi:hypothetical protein
MVFQKTLAVNDFYFGSDDYDFPMGHISFVGKLDGVALSAGAPKIAPGFTLDMMARRSLDFRLTSEDLPDPNNRVTLDREGNIVLSYTPNNLEPHKRLRKKLESLMNRQTKCAEHGHSCHVGLFSRSLFLGRRIPPAGVALRSGSQTACSASRKASSCATRTVTQSCCSTPTVTRRTSDLKMCLRA